MKLKTQPLDYNSKKLIIQSSLKQNYVQEKKKRNNMDEDGINLHRKQFHLFFLIFDRSRVMTCVI